jgi:hypothetical protein
MKVGSSPLLELLLELLELLGVVEDVGAAAVVAGIADEYIELTCIESPDLMV